MVLPYTYKTQWFNGICNVFDCPSLHQFLGTPCNFIRASGFVLENHLQQNNYSCCHVLLKYLMILDTLTFQNNHRMSLESSKVYVFMRVLRQKFYRFSFRILLKIFIPKIDKPIDNILKWNFQSISYFYQTLNQSI